MKRLRLVFAALALVLLVPVALLVHRALGSVEAERAMRHRATADRIVDEMERELTAWLRIEEDRPFDHYRFFRVPEGSPPEIVNLERSPLSTPPAEPFVVCYFQIDPDGTVSSPLWPGNEALAASLAGWQPNAETRELVDLVEGAVRDFWRGDAPAASAGRRQGVAPGTTVAVGAKQQKLPADGSSLTVLEQLNRGALERRKRPAKVAPSQATNVYNFARDRANVLQEALQKKRETVEADDVEETWTRTVEVNAEIEAALETGALGTVDVRLEPLVGRPITPEHLVLYRTVSFGGEAYRQGLVLDAPALVDWLERRVLAAGDLAARAGIRLARGDAASTDAVSTAATGAAATGAAATGADAASTDAASAVTGLYGYVFRHRFAEPFGALAADVTLSPLPELPGTLYLYALSALLAFAATAGLYALYRTVAVTVAFAERRQNFVSAVTHELKTPLTALRMHSEMLRDGMVADEPKRQRSYEIMTAEAERLTRLVQNVLELAQLEQKTRRVRLEAGDVVPVLQEVLSVLGPHAERQGFTLRLDVEPGLPRVRFDRDALLQVLFNLVDNALKYSSDAERKEIVLRCRRHDGGVCLTVADRGPGVARRHLKQIFEPFYRGEDELTRTAKGTGIGLALVRGLVERMGGRVVGRNARDGGFEVEVSLAAA